MRVVGRSAMRRMRGGSIRLRPMHFHADFVHAGNLSESFGNIAFDGHRGVRIARGDMYVHAYHAVFNFNSLHQSEGNNVPGKLGKFHRLKGFKNLLLCRARQGSHTF